MVEPRIVEPRTVELGTARTLLARTARVQRDGRAPSLVAGVVRDGGLAWSTGRGAVAEPHTDVQYRLGSISKTVTAVAVLRLRDEGRLGLDDPLETHVPGTGWWWRETKRPEGSTTALMPSLDRSKHPTSSTGPKRFFRARTMRSRVDRSPSKCSTTSTMCSSTRGPAMPPSLVT